MTPRCSLVIANAGSGKTWTLANRIIRWSLDELRAGRAPEPARVLAVTFTRKAAGEILARILSHAAQAAATGEAGAKARREFEAEVGTATEPVTADEYLEVLKALCAELHRLQVGTIDGFFHRIASAMPEEVGLPAEWTLGDDREVDALRAQAAAEILSDAGADALVSLLERGEPKPSVTRAITALLGGKSITPLDIYRATAAGGPACVRSAWGWIDDLPVRRDLGAEQFDQLAESVAALVVPTKKDGQPDSRWRTALDGLVAILRARDFRKLAGNTLFVKMAEGEPYQKRDMPDDFAAAASMIEPHLRKALIEDIDRQLKGALAVLPKASEALDRLQHEQGVFGFGDIGRGVARAASRAGSRVADPAALRAALGADIRDLAIDEAQDTSVEQFLSLRPLLDEVLSGARGGRFLLVGDPKQSIYGWRGGTPGLVAHIERAYASQLGPGVSLTRSFRSSPLVMDFVNRVFGNLADDVLHFVDAEHREPLLCVRDWVVAHGLPEDSIGSAFRRAVEAWPFARHESAKATLPGCVTAYAYGEAADTGGSGNADDAGEERAGEQAGEHAGEHAGDRVAGAANEVSAASCAAAIAARLHRDSPGRTIGILVRTNTEVAEIVAELKRLGVAASDEGRATLLDSPAVARVVALLQLVDDPGNRIAHFMVSRGAMQSVTRLAPLESHENLEAAECAARAYAAGLRAAVADRGLAAVLREVFVALRGSAGLAARDEVRLARVIAIAEAFDADAGARASSRLVDFIDTIGDDKADSSSTDKVRVMTVHKSKGLEFDEVVLASLDDGWGSAPRDWGMLVTSPTEPPRMVAPLVNEDVRRWVPELAVFERDERRRRVLDDLSALYVALTRARQGLHLVMKAVQGGTLPTAAKLIVRAIDRDLPDGSVDAMSGAPKLASALAAAAPDAEQPFWSHEFGEHPPLPAAAPTQAPSPHAAAVEPAIHAEPLVTPVARAGARASAPSMHSSMHSTMHSTTHAATHASSGLWQFDPFGDDDTALRGVLVHECFREIESVASIATDAQRAALAARAARRAAVEKGTLISDDLVQQACALLARVASGPLGLELRSGTGVVVRTELPFVREVEAGLIHGRIDRLELDVAPDLAPESGRDGGRVVRAVIIDFKTGAEHSDADAYRRKKHEYFGQLEAYRAAVSELFKLDRSAIAIKLLFVDRGTVEVG